MSSSARPGSRAEDRSAASITGPSCLEAHLPQRGRADGAALAQGGLDPKEHLAIGAALAPLRDEGVFIVASGMTFHNLRAFRDPRALPVAETFDAWLRETATSPAKERDARLAAWTAAPSARLAHPREEHLIPLMVAAGAAGADIGSVPYNGAVWGVRLSAVHFG
ncbi:MAG: class III extradiol ring-cleavage dioxygenase [Polyangiaceae bacterium]